MAHTGLLGGIVLMMFIKHTYETKACTNCYHPVYDGEDLRSLFRVHTNVNPNCFDHSQLNTCQEDGKVYWTTKNTASYAQRLFGECPIGDTWLCFEADQKGLRDIIKEKVLTTKFEKSLDIPSGKNLFIDLVERISRELNLTECWICGGTQMSEIWPWEGISLSPLEILKWKQTEQNTRSLRTRGREKWDLKSKIIGEECIMRTGTRYQTCVGKLMCKRYIIVINLSAKWVPKGPNKYWSTENTEKCIFNERYELYECIDKAINPFWGIKELSRFWQQPFETREDYWEAPNHLFWICGDTAYTKLPGDWSGSCTIGIIKPAFFLLPKRLGAHLGVPVYDNLGKVERKKRDTLTIGGDQKWKGKIWTPEEIIKTYGPATWAQDGSWGYRTPIYMLNRIIRLQAVLEMVSNRTALALDHISDQLTQTRAVIYQIRLAVDYLLADEGGICGKFNSSECCLEIDDKSAVIKNISKEIRKLAYVGNQEWTPLMDTNWWNSFWSFKGDWWKKAGFMIICSITGLMFLPCLIPFLIRTITSTVQASIQIPKATSQKQTKMMVIESQGPEHENAKEIYEKFQKCRKIYFQEEELLEALVAVVATLGELVATARPPRRDLRLFMTRDSLHQDLRRFIWRLRDTLELHNVTALGHRGVTFLGQAVATQGATLGDTWTEVRAAARAWRDSVDALLESWKQLSWDAMDLHATWSIAASDEATDEASATGLAGDLQDETTGQGTAGDDLGAMAGQLPVAQASAVATKATEEAMVATSQAGSATRRGQQAEAALGLLDRLVDACMEASMLPVVLQDCLSYVELILNVTEETSPNVPQTLVAAVAEAEQLCEASSSLDMRHLLGTLEKIDILLSSPHGGTGGPGGPGGPGGSEDPGGPSSHGGFGDPGGHSGHLEAKRCQEASEDTPSHTATCGETNNGSPVSGTPEQPEGTWGKPKPGAAGETAGDLPSDPNLLPPGARCELATSKSITFLKACCHECIPTGVMGTSQQRQDFLIIGKESNRALGLSVLPAVVSANCNEELKVLAFTHKAPMVIEPKTPIAIAIALPMSTNKRAGYQEMPFESFNCHGRWVKHIGNAQPMLTCRLTCGNESQKCSDVTPDTLITGTLDTAADVTVISYASWPRDWNLVIPVHGLAGIGGGSICMQSEFMITVTGPEGKTAKTRPYVVKGPITVWGRDVLSQWGTKMEVGS
ncbi:hypothetical protein DUI87_06067 [Hirundo rustica rustica]|uniref:Peptidase A2 domain-containing protein n=4 Tax=Neoaves TaxID=3078114 RepID=A0A3M0KZA1_HIRRU|nr:hypothetical protein DUI87_06067 [Hirundo rustica rustica]